MSSKDILLCFAREFLKSFRAIYNYLGATPIRTPGRVSDARREIAIRFFGWQNPETHRVSDLLPAPLEGESDRWS